MADKRKSISAKRRFDIFKRDLFVCQYCGRHPPDVVLEVDHIVPVAKGGGNDDHNLITACFDCNSGKRADPITAMPFDISERHRLLEERMAQVRAYDRLLARQRRELLAKVEMVDDVAAKMLGARWVDPLARKGIEKFLGRLPVSEVIEAMEIAIYRLKSDPTRIWPYFCGICWRKIKGDNRG